MCSCSHTRNLAAPKRRRGSMWWLAAWTRCPCVNFERILGREPPAVLFLTCTLAVYQHRFGVRKMMAIVVACNDRGVRETFSLAVADSARDKSCQMRANRPFLPRETTLHLPLYLAVPHAFSVHEMCASVCSCCVFIGV